MARKKSVSQIQDQLARIRNASYDLYGDDDRGRALRTRAKNAANTYIGNIADAIGGDRGKTFDPALGNKSYQKVSRRVYMGLNGG